MIIKEKKTCDKIKKSQENNNKWSSKQSTRLR